MVDVQYAGRAQIGPVCDVNHLALRDSPEKVRSDHDEIYRKVDYASSERAGQFISPADLSIVIYAGLYYVRQLAPCMFHVEHHDEFLQVGKPNDSFIRAPTPVPCGTLISAGDGKDGTTWQSPPSLDWVGVSAA